MPLGRSEDLGGPSTLADIVLDFDADGRLLGIEIIGVAEAALRPEVLEGAERSAHS